MSFRPLVILATIAAVSAAFAQPIPPEKPLPVKKAVARKSVARKTVAKKAFVKSSAKGPVGKTVPQKRALVKGPVSVKKAGVPVLGHHEPKPATRAGLPVRKPVGEPLAFTKPVVKPSVAKKAFPKTLGAKRPVAKKTAGKGPILAVRPLASGIEKKAIQAKYDQMSLLVMRRDGKRLATLLLGMTTPDFVYRDKKGRSFNRAKLIGQLKAQMTMVKSFKRSGNKVAGFGLGGSVATVKVISDFAMIFPNGKKNVTVSGQSTTSDTWIKTTGGWKLRQIRTLKESVKYDGKSV